MRKLTILGIFMCVILATGATFAFVGGNSCGYDPVTGNFIDRNGSVYSFGTMDDAAACAAEGVLPDVVISRLGKWGDASIKAKAEEIKALNSKVKAEKEAAKAKTIENK